MQKYSLPLWLFALLACTLFGRALAAEPASATFDVHCNTHKELLKTKLSLLRAKQAMLADSLHWKSALHSEAIAFGLLSVSYALMSWMLHQEDGRLDVMLASTVVSSFTGAFGFAFALAPIINFLELRILRNKCVYLEKEIATIKD